MTDLGPFTPDAVAAIVRHMNDDHADDTLVICRHQGGEPAASAATVTDLGPAGLDLVALVDGEERPVHVDWTETPSDRPGIRHEIVRLFEEASASTPRS